MARVAPEKAANPTALPQYNFGIPLGVVVCVTVGMVRHVLKGRAKTVKGYSFRYAKGKEQVD